MKEIVKINLDNEMDLILAHKRAMKIAEMCGMPSSAQTRFSTAVSEVARCSIAKGKNSVLRIGINILRPSHKEILAVLTDAVDLKKCNPEAYQYAAKISGNIEYSYSDNQSVTTLSQQVAAPGLLSDIKIKSLVDYFKYEPPLSPYDEIRKKNIELIALSEKLGESENRYRQLANTLPVLISVVNERNHVLIANDSLKDYVQQPFTVFDKKTLATFIHPDDLDEISEGWSKAKKDRSDFFGETRIKKDSEYVWHLISIIPNKAEDGSFNSWLVYFVDINAQKTVVETLKDNSELKMIQQELENANSKLLFKNKELEQFAFIASHDLQEPLRKILIMLSRAAEFLTEEQRKQYYFDKITLAAGRLSTLISDVLNYSRIDNKLQNLQELDLNHIITETISDLSLVIEEKNALITVEALPRVSGVSSQLRQLFYNLINNALKFNTSQPSIIISSALSDNFKTDKLSPVGNFYVISVSDNGIGMDNEYSGRIFDMFQRLHQRDQFGGNGIGLALCKRIIENHGGVINFTSKPDEGTTFWIYLPKRD
ncbi:PAS domain S-box protein [Flavobacterium sp. JLP]|uniref:sensor histidine kinase n=1 Tax=unclassified Flavobacterium TaxID=196869 RepID=UPI00188A8D9E|nr:MULTISPECIES: PAS domain-containing sensor histidine kinase [unclassified Flavobacterium]MBF4494192.1 PAS domain S-box protein [Flavobacterium sp. MR2016-29]MBF4507711.1 PAS domain S-box protein [Flavobacterium sp. JLP]